MRVRRVISAMSVVALTIGVLSAVAGTGSAGAATTSTLGTMIKRGVTSLGRAAPKGAGRLNAVEMSKALKFVNRSLSTRPGPKQGIPGVPKVRPNLVVPKVRTNSAQVQTFEGLNHHDQRTANGGNQFSLEPPDQGLCVGNHHVIEVINDVIKPYTDLGVGEAPVESLNEFFGYPPEINRTTGEFGPFPTDPSCTYFPEQHVFVVLMLTLDTDPATGNFLGTNHLDLAVSTGPTPLGSWNLYSIPAQDDGTDGTPNHNCTGGPCIGDFPHLGADRFGFYITTNEYDFFGPNFHTAQIYAMAKKKLASGAPSVPFVHLANLHLGAQAGFTVWPALAIPGQYNLNNGGTEYFLSSRAAAETGNPNGFANSIGMWTLTNTKTLEYGSPRIRLTNKAMASLAYGIPPLSNQKAGDIPLGDCMADPTCASSIGFAPGDIANTSEGPLDSSDTRMMQVWYSNGRLWSALDTIVSVAIPDPPFYKYEAAVLWFVVNPATAHVQKQDYLVAAPDGDDANNITYPAFAVLPNGRGLIGMTLSGIDYYPSQVWVTMTAAGPVDAGVPNGGVGPQDGFTEYQNYQNDFTRPRWGDYGGAVTQGSTIWVANEVINQTCDDTTWNADHTCGGTRTTLGNWSTQISQVIP